MEWPTTPHILRTRLYQASALAISLDEGLQQALSEILWDEFGRGDASRSHPSIYRKFLVGLRFEPSDWANAPILPELQSYIRVHRQLCTKDPVAAIGVAGTSTSITLG